MWSTAAPAPPSPCRSCLHRRWCGPPHPAPKELPQRRTPPKQAQTVLSQQCKMPPRRERRRCPKPLSLRQFTRLPPQARRRCPKPLPLARWPSRLSSQPRSNPPQCWLTTRRRSRRRSTLLPRQSTRARSRNSRPARNRPPPVLPPRCRMAAPLPRQGLTPLRKPDQKQLGPILPKPLRQRPNPPMHPRPRPKPNLLPKPRPCTLSPF
jgi:hypothetical protein